MSRVVVVGGGGHAKVVISVLKRSGWEVLGFTDERERGPVLTVPYLGTDAVLPGLVGVEGRCDAVVGVGKVDASPARISVWGRLKDLGFSLPAVVSPSSIVNEAVDLGEGTFVGDGVVVNSGTSTVAICILNTHCTVEHDCRLGDNVHVAPGATISGGVTVGDNCMIGAGATVIQGVTICAGVLVGAGATVVKDLRVPGTYVGIPARRAS